jgi:predicted nucleic acid-binding protein
LIVVDTNIIAYSVLPSQHGEAARALVRKDADWVAPSLWRAELRNVLATAMRVRGIPLARALRAFEDAERLVEESAVPCSTSDCLQIAARGGISAYDAEFVWLAEELDVALVTSDRALVRAFPRRAQLLTTFVTG